VCNFDFLTGRDLTEEEEAGIEKRLQSYIDEEVNRGYFPTRENILIFRENERRRILGQDLGAPPRVWLSKSTQTPTQVQDGLGYLHMPPESASTTASGTPSPFQEGGKKTGKLVVSY